MRTVTSVLSMVGLLAVAVPPAFAQGEPQIPIQFDFINPGARSLALGGAFIGVADDATAAATNPAGLQRLSRPEVSIEGRGWTFVTDVLQGGRISGSATTIGIDTVGEPVFGESRESVAGLSFVSVVYPRGQWSFSGYRQEASRLRYGAATDGAFFIDTDQAGVLRNFREFPSVAARSIDVINYGGAVAFRRGIVSVGGGVHLSQFSFESELVGFDLPDFFGPTSYSEPIFVNLQSGDDWGVGFAGGVLVVPNDKVQFGASYRRGASFEFEGNLDYPDFPEFSGAYGGDFKVPDNFGAGVAVRPVEGLTVALDLNRVFYSDLEDFVQAQALFEPDETLYTIDDATEIHIGAEYVLTRVRLLPALRGGFWRETAHGVNYAGEDVLYQATAALAKDINHFAVGAGIAPSRRLEVNAGFDFSDRGKTMSFSGIFRF